ncbi:NAD(P)-binding protein [Lophiostoma macrostomum CBS 122681]|uniref:NAD(P)-binding protein n=1 Tax=Lophiostoma macrostomum CBS 122681 TaxID=1314788 RepID=A0A6A6TCX1_9PLEO|nr:NAD(P)-binding protein [Lophiostoma macrostomum CBS 122681]
MASAIPLGSVLVVGGCGFLGHHIVKEILRRKEDQSPIVVLDSNTQRNRQSAVTYHQLDIASYDQVLRVFAEVRPRVVFHTASPSPFERDRVLLEKVNVNGTRNLIDSSVIHNQRSPLVDATEELPVLHYPEQPEYYSHTKALAEEIVLAANRGAGRMLTVSIRPATLYGEGDGIITTNLCKQALSGRARFHFGHGKNLYDVAYVENCTYAQMLAAEALLRASTTDPLPKESRVEGEAFHVTDGVHVPFWGLQRLVAKIAGRPVQEEDARSVPRWLVMLAVMVAEWLYWLLTLGKKQPTVTRFSVDVVSGCVPRDDGDGNAPA